MYINITALLHTVLVELKLTFAFITYYYNYSLGGSPDDYPHPGVDSSGFVKAITAKNNAEPKVWNPITKKMAHWIDIGNMKSIVGGKCIIS